MRRSSSTITCRSRRAFAGAAAIALGISLVGCSRSGGPSFKNTDITGASYASRLDLPDFEGRRRTLADFKGKVTTVFFGFTHCPDVCPTTLAEMKAVREKLGPDANQVQVIFVTVDPERDTPELLKNYVTAFDPSFIGLRGTPEETAATAKEFKVFVQKVPGKTEGQYTVDHTAGTYVFDRAGRIRLFVRHGQGIDPIVSDIKTLLAEGGA